MRILFTIFLMMFVTACSSTSGSRVTTPHGTIATPKPIAGVNIMLADRSFFHQQDPRWAMQTLGGSGEPLKSDGCLVTAAAMALANLGFQTNPGDLVNRLKASGGFTARGWLVWSGLEKVTGGIASTRFYTDADDAHVKNCLDDGFYPLVKFKLPSRSTHWALVVAQGDKGFYVRDPMVSAEVPILLSSRAQKIESVRCIGVERV